MGTRGGVGKSDELLVGPASSSAETIRARHAPPEWYDVTWNPTAGCSPAGPGCDHCQARYTVAQLARLGGHGGARYAGLTVAGRSGLEWTGQIRVRPELITWPLLQHQPRRVLVDSMSDLFHEQLPTGTIDILHAVMTIAHWHRFLVLTRRAERMRGYYADPGTPRRIAMEIANLAATVLPRLGASAKSAAGENGHAPPAGRARRAGVWQRWSAGLERVVRRAGDPDAAEPDPVGLDPWPLPNLLLGVSVEDQDHVGRIGDLMRVPAALRWACFEPLLGPVRPDLVPIDGGYADVLGGGRPQLDWVVAGGEIGAGARPTSSDWVRALRDRCVSADVPFLFKAWGEWGPQWDTAGERMVRLGRRATGRLIDGRCWNELPAELNPGGRRRSRPS
jgi:protein gp37